MKKLCLLGIILGTFVLQPSLQACGKRVDDLISQDNSYLHQSPSKKGAKQPSLTERVKANDEASHENEECLVKQSNRHLSSQLKNAKKFRVGTYVLDVFSGSIGGYFAFAFPPYSIPIVFVSALAPTIYSHAVHPTYEEAENTELLDKEDIKFGVKLDFGDDDDNQKQEETITRQKTDMTSAIAVRDMLENSRFWTTLKSPVLALIFGGIVFFGLSSNSK